MTHQRVENLLGYAVIDIHFHFWGLGDEISTIFAAVFFSVRKKEKVDRRYLYDGSRLAALAAVPRQESLRGDSRRHLQRSAASTHAE